MILQELKSQNLIHPPKFLVGNTQYLTRMGSEAYGVSIDSSDVDIYGFTIPPKEIVSKYGYNTKQGYHTVRLLSEVEMILAEGDLDLQRNREQLKSIRRGEWTEQDVVDYFSRKEIELETLYQNSKLPYSPDENKIKQLLLNCLEQHYGSIDNMLVVPGKYESAIKEIEAICARVRGNK